MCLCAQGLCLCMSVCAQVCVCMSVCARTHTFEDGIYAHEVERSYENCINQVARIINLLKIV